MKTFSKTPSEQEFKNVECALCKAGKSSTVWKNSTVPFVKCSKCGLVFQNPQPVEDELLKRYDNEYFDYEMENSDVFFRLMKLGLKDVGFFKIETDFFIRSDNEKPSFLDVGCATGRLLQYMRGRGWNVKGIEVCRPAAMYGINKYQLDIYPGTIETAGLPDKSFDVVHSSHLIEHLIDPCSFISETARLLKPGGLFIVVTPDISGFQAKLFGERWRSAIADHMYLFSGRTLRKLISMYGFRILKTATWGGLAAGTAPLPVKKAADKLAKRLGIGDVVCIMGMLKP